MGFGDYLKICDDLEKLESERDLALERIQKLRVCIAKWELEVFRMENMIKKLKKEVGR